MDNEALTLPLVFLELDQLQRELIDEISKLRQGLAAAINPPQVVVCGNCSSGKTSVLEAISGIKFPVGKPTAIATQVNLRQAPFASVHVSREIDGVLHHEPQLSKFFGFDKDHDVVDITQKAAKLMKVKIDKHGVSDEVLHITVSGPDLRSLTLVDLPGLRPSTVVETPHFRPSCTSDEETPIIDRLADRYMSRQNNIILAIASARYGIAPRNVFDRVLRYDPQGDRSIGVLTKVSRVQNDILTLATNKDSIYKFANGWVVLRNTGADEATSCDADKTTKNVEIFGSDLWRGLRQSGILLGTFRLRQRVGSLVYERIREQVPGIIRKLEVETPKARTLHELGPARTNPEQQSRYLTEVSAKFQSLANAAIRGDYSERFFSLPTNKKLGALTITAKDEACKLRSVVDDLNLVFYKILTAKGHKQSFVDTEGSPRQKCLPFNPFTRYETVQPWIHRYSTSDPEETTLDLLLENMRKHAATKGVSGWSSSAVDAYIVEEFRDQSSPWRYITNCHVEVLVDVAKTFIDRLVLHVVNHDTSIHSRIMLGLVEPFFNARRLALRDKCEELLRHLGSGVSRPLQPSFRARMELDPRTRLADPDKLFESLEKLDLDDKEALPAAKDDGGPTEQHSVARQVFDGMMAYYDISLRTYIDNVVILAVENCLIAQIPSILDPTMVAAMSDAKLASLVAEPPETIQIRQKLEKDLASLIETLGILKRHVPAKSCAATALRSSTSTNPEDIPPSRPARPLWSKVLGKGRFDGVKIRICLPPVPQHRRSASAPRTATLTPSSEPVRPSSAHQLATTSPFSQSLCPVTRPGRQSKSSTPSPPLEPVTPLHAATEHGIPTIRLPQTTDQPKTKDDDQLSFHTNSTRSSFDVDAFQRSISHTSWRRHSEDNGLDTLSLGYISDDTTNPDIEDSHIGPAYTERSRNRSTSVSKDSVSNDSLPRPRRHRRAISEHSHPIHDLDRVSMVGSKSPGCERFVECWR